MTISTHNLDDETINKMFNIVGPISQVTPVYDGDIYDPGDIIPGHIEQVATPHIWYDKSRQMTDGTVNVFERLSVSGGYLLGETEDDVWTYSEVLDAILKYLNLHIVQIGFDFYIFDWNTSKNSNVIDWIDILTGDKKTTTNGIVNVTKSMYADNSTQITMSDVYNQIMLTDKVEKLDDVILSPFDNDSLIDVAYKQHYMDEFGASGEGDKAYNAFKRMMKGELPQANYNDNDSAYRREWWFNVKKSNNWRFLKNNVDCYSVIPVDGNNKYYQQWQLCKSLYETPFTSGIVSFGAGEKINTANYKNIDNITSFTNYLCIAVNGNGVDEKSSTNSDDGNDYFWNLYGNNRTPFPSDDDLKNSNMRIEYINPTDAQYSSGSADVTNYLLFSGKITMTIPQQRTGINVEGSVLLHNYTDAANDNRRNYLDYAVFLKRNHTYNHIKYLIDNNKYFKYCTVPDESNDDGQYYTNLFYTTNYPNAETETTDEYHNMLCPPQIFGSQAKRFRYDLTGKTSYYSRNGGYDVIPFVDILACQLSIGNMYCEEYIDSSTGEKKFNWVSENDLKTRGNGTGYTVLPDGTTRYNAYINIAIDINSGQYLIGESHDIYNNIRTNMGIDKKGMAIPLPFDKHLSGELRFTIIGPVNTTWDQGIRRHPTWFRHSSYTENYVSILPHIGHIWIEKFDVNIVTDGGKNAVANDSDIVYVSDEQHKYIKKKDDIEFKFITTLTAEDAAKMGVNIDVARNNIIDASDGSSVINIVNNITNETNKPEKFYVDDYYNEYHTPRIIVDTALHNSKDINYFNKYNINYLNKKLYVLAMTNDVKNNNINLKLKEV